MSKLNQALLDWYPGDIHGLGWFREKNIDQRLAYSYYQSGFLRKVGPGVFARKNDDVNWQGVIRFLQEELKLSLHVAGRSALELHGHGHYIVLGGRLKIDILSYQNRSFPSWLKDGENGFDLFFSKSSLLKRENFLTDYIGDGFKLRISTRELAILEFIDSIDLTLSLETVENYMVSLNTLRPEVVQKVLEECHSIKAKRIFLYLAEKLSLPFMKKINFKKISLGVGKRVVVKGGEFNKKYQITVDRNFGENPF